MKFAKDNFKKWLSEHGCELLSPTNEWEVIRFKANGNTGIIYKNKDGHLRFTGEAVAAHEAYKKQEPYRGTKKTRRVKLTPLIKSLIDRDGEDCFYCKQEIQEEDISIEHLVPITHGGPNHVSNLVLAHRKCNLEAGHLSVMDKIKKRELVNASN